MRLLSKKVVPDPRGGPDEVYFYFLGILLFIREVIPHPDGSIYMIRYKLFQTKWARLFLHNFYTSDGDRDFHDHPFHFASVILWPGYKEHTDKGVSRKFPGMLLLRKAAHRHAVELFKRHDGTEYKTWTLVFLTGKVREWGFHTKDGFVHNLKYIQDSKERPPK